MLVKNVSRFKHQLYFSFLKRIFLILAASIQPFMYEYIKGKFIELNPSYLIVESSGVAWFVSISLQTFTKLNNRSEGLVYLHQVVKEDAHLLYGFSEKTERELFRQLITVSGVGASTARMMLSSLETEEIRKAILTGNVEVLKSVKGIGLKSAQRIVIELKDKIGKEPAGSELFLTTDNTIREESLSALVMLGFSKAACEKVIGQLLRENPDLLLEDLIKLALKKL